MKYFPLFTSLAVYLMCSFPAFSGDSYTLFLVRHAEKQKEAENPHLTQCGKFRAKQLASTLKNVDLQAVYSTSYHRTLETAAPSAKTHKVGVKQYSPRGLEQLARMLQSNKKNALIVGHSNTIPVLAELLLDQKIKPIAEDEFKHLFQINFIGEKVNLIKLTQPLNCNSNKR